MSGEAGRLTCLSLFVILSATAALVGCKDPSRAAAAGPRDIAIPIADGADLIATIYPVAAPAPPGLILIHSLGSDRNEWTPLARYLAREGYLIVTYDLRGHGAGQGVPEGPQTSFHTFKEDDWLALVEDISAAKEALLDHGADPKNIGLIGADLGANAALLYALADTQIQATVLLSPGLSYKGLDLEGAMERLGRRPLLILVSEGDSYSAATGARLKREAPGYCELRVYPGSAHGADLLAAVDTAMGQIHLWLSDILEE